jgi:hypothetical protein
MKTKWAIGTGGAGLILVIIHLAFAMGQRNPVRPAQPIEVPQQEVAGSTETYPVEESPVTYDRYEFDGYGFTFELPSNWVFEDYVDGSPRALRNKTPGKDELFEIIDFGNTDLTLQELTRQIKDEDPSVVYRYMVQEERKIDGRDALYATVEISMHLNVIGYYYLIFFRDFHGRNLVAKLDCAPFQTFEPDKVIFEHFIETFRFNSN